MNIDIPSPSTIFSPEWDDDDDDEDDDDEDE